MSESPTSSDSTFYPRLINTRFNYREVRKFSYFCRGAAQWLTPSQPTMVPSQLTSQLRLTGTIYLTPRTTVWRSAKARRVRCSCLLGSRPPEAPEDQSRKYKKTFRTPLSQRGAKVFLLLLRGRSVAYSQSARNGSQSTFQSTSVDWEYISYT